MKKQRKAKPKARARVGSAPQRGVDARAAAHKKRQISYAYAVTGHAPSALDFLRPYLPSADRVREMARGSFELFEDRAGRVRAFAFDDVPQKVRPHVSRVRHAAISASRSYSHDDRELAALLILPFLIIASAMMIGQSVKRWENFEVPVAYERPSVESARLARARAIAAEPIIALSPRAEVPSGAALVAPGDVPATSLDRFAASTAEPVRDGMPLGAIARVPESSASAIELLDEALPASQPREQLAMLNPGASAMLDIGPGRALAPAPMTEIPALEDDGSFGGAKHMCLAAPPSPPRIAASTPQPEVFGRMLAAAALAQTESFVIYNDDYRAISYPGGDVPQIFGVCTDVIVRAYRAVGVDLQRAVHEAKVGSGDVNIDHRRVEVLRRFFAKVGESLPITDVAEDYQPGDIVSYYRPQNQSTRSHIAIVSSVLAPSGRLMIIHNRGWGPQLEDGLFVDQITGHYRYTGRAQSAGVADPLAKKGQRATAVTPASLSRPAGVAAKATPPQAAARSN